MTNDPLDPATAPYPSAGARTADTNPPVDVDPRSTTADPSTTDADRRVDVDSSTADAERPADVDPSTTDAERPDYSVDQVGDDRTPAAGQDDAYPADADASPTTRNVDADEPLVPTTEGVDFKARWDVIQQGFVDDPRTAVTDADKLVGDVLARLSATFDEQHRTLEGQWSNGEPDTEALRSALQRYRAFFERLLTI
ncbi:MAG: hypothetical protein QOH84_2839 [Kribbellaceae bacterium]|jgi:hypothetical protein|nr:hypothetical protein [Kribbellaceae bacterium]